MATNGRMAMDANVIDERLAVLQEVADEVAAHITKQDGQLHRIGEELAGMAAAARERCEVLRQIADGWDGLGRRGVEPERRGSGEPSGATSCGDVAVDDCLGRKNGRSGPSGGGDCTGNDEPLLR
jgi:hypothetical protein